MPELTVAVFNLHWGRGRFFPRPRAPFDVPSLLRAYDADVYVLPEHFRTHDGAGLVDPLVAEDGYCVEEVRFSRIAFDRRPQVENPGDGWWTLAVLSRLPVVAYRELPLGRWIHDPAGARAAPVVTVDVDGRLVDVVGVHTSSKLWWAAPVVHLLRLRRHLRGAGERPTVVAGDCNLWGPAVELLLPGFRRAVRGRTYPSHRPHSQIDHVLVDDRVEALGGEVLGATPSDHRALRARLHVP